MTEPGSVPVNDAIAEAISDALTRTVVNEPSAPIPWSAVTARARRVVRMRRVLAVSACAAVVLGATGVAVAARPGSEPSHISVVAPPTTHDATTTPTLTTTTTAPPVVTSGPPATSPSSTATSTTSTTTAPAPPDTTAHPQPAGAGDFTGQIDHWGDSCGPCTVGVDTKNVELTIRNTTDRPIDLSPSASMRVALVCSTAMTPDGRLAAPLRSDDIDWLADEAADASGRPTGGAADVLAAGAQAVTLQIGYAFSDAGALTCEGALVTSSDGSWRTETLAVTARLTHVSVYTVEVVDAPPTSASNPNATSGS